MTKDTTPPFHVLIVEASFYQDIGNEMRRGTIAILKEAGATYEIVIVPGALEIPAAIRYAVEAGAGSSGDGISGEGRLIDGYVVLGCVIRGETSHYDIVCGECSRGIMDLAQEFSLAVGFGLLTVENHDQAWARAAVDKGDQGARAARACLHMVRLKRDFQLYPR
jgi:6,7-dimethyl-8-ribityllumazine synthase